jgi:hypothetical protein
MMCGMAPPSDRNARHLQKLAALVTQRRVALGLRSKEAAAKQCDIAPMTYRKVEAGEPVTDTTYGKVEVGLGMRPGSCKAVLEGADSITLDDGTELIEGGQIRDHVDPAQLVDALPRALQKSATLYAPHLTLEQVDAINEELMEELRRLGILPEAD